MTATQNLINAIHKNNIDDVLTALKNGADVNGYDGYQSILDTAIQNDNPKVVSLLLEKGKNKIYQSSLEKGLFNTFKNNKNSRKIAQIISENMNDASASSQYNPTYVWACIQLDWPEVLDTVLKKNASLSEKDHFGHNPLHETITLNRIKCAKVLCNYIQDIDEFSGQHNASQWAARMGRTEILEHLIDKGSNINLSQSTLLDDIKVLLFFSTGFLYTPKLSNQNKVIHWAARSNEPKVIDMLMHKCPERVSLDQPGEDDKTPLIQALEAQSFATLKRLLEYGADPNAMDKIGTVLHAAVRLNNSDVFNLLFEYGVDQRLKGPCGKTALEYARYLEDNHFDNYSYCIEKLEKAWKQGSSIAKGKPYYRPKGHGRSERE